MGEGCLEPRLACPCPQKAHGADLCEKLPPGFLFLGTDWPDRGHQPGPLGLHEGQRGWMAEILGHLGQRIYRMGLFYRGEVGAHPSLVRGGAAAPSDPLPQLSLQKMLMKQQDRLEEREQDIEDQLYKLESDKRLVEVAKPKFMVGVGAAWVQGLGLVLIWVRICVWSALCQNPLVSHSLNCQLLSPTGVAGTEPCATSRSNLALRNPGQSGGLGSQTLSSRMPDRQKRQPVFPSAHLPAHPCPLLPAGEGEPTEGRSAAAV